MTSSKTNGDFWPIISVVATTAFWVSRRRLSGASYNARSSSRHSFTHECSRSAAYLRATPMPCLIGLGVPRISWIRPSA